MTIKGNEMTVIRGETFTIDRVVVNKDGSPFIVSSEYNNPYILITVSSTRYAQSDRYSASWWLNLSDLTDENGDVKPLPRFKYTRPIQITAFGDNVDTAEHLPGEYLYYVDDITKCKYFDYNDGKKVWYDYDFRIIHHFVHEVTSKWSEQSYMYSIRLVSGQDTGEYVRNLYKSVFNKEPETHKTTEELYDELREFDENYVINIERPIVIFDVVQDILVPTKLTVLSDLNGGLL